MSGGELRFGLSRSLGRDESFGRARDFAALLDQVGFATVVPYDSYQKLERALLAGEVDAAWAPPVVCARVEQAGGVIALRAVRAGAVEYGAAVLRDFHYRFALEEMPELQGLRAAWVDEYSMGGYILPRHTLRMHGVDLDKTFAEEKLLGSYDACLLAVLQGKADVTACFYSGPAEKPVHGYVTLMGDRSRFFNLLALSEPTPNDGVALSPAVTGDRTETLREIFRKLAGAERALLATALGAQTFDEPPEGTYKGLIGLLG